MNELRSIGQLAAELSAGGRHIESWQIRRACEEAGIQPTRVGRNRAFTAQDVAKVRAALERRQRSQ
jgi:hypothetical protein